MKWLRRTLDRIEPIFGPEGRLHKLYPLWEGIDSFLYTPGSVTQAASHVRDGMDLKRMMMTVVYALIPCILMAMWNTGYQANTALQDMGLSSADGWRGDVLERVGVGVDPACFLSNFLHGALYFIPVYLVCNMVGGFWEVLFSCVRKHDVNEGFLVTGLLFPLILPPSIPLWQVAIGISFGVVLGKEVFGGTGRNFMNPALTARVFLYFAYPAQMSGDAVWTAVDGFSGATPLGAVATAPVGQGMSVFDVSWLQAFFGCMQGSMGETSTLACLLGAAILIYCGVAAWRIMAGTVAGAMVFATLLWAVGSDTNPMFQMNPFWHFVLGGFAFGTVFMATDPVSSAVTHLGQWIYGVIIGLMTILIRVINPAYPEGIMLAILFGNVFAPLIDYYVVQANIKRRMARHVA